MEFDYMNFNNSPHRGKKRRRITVLRDIVTQTIFFSLAIVWMELIYHLFSFGTIGKEFIYPALFSIALGIGITLLTGFFGTAVNRLIAWTVLGVFSLFYIVQLVYLKIFKTPLIWGVAKEGAGDATAYWKEGLEAVVQNMPAIILLLIPLFVFGFLVGRFIRVGKRVMLLQLIILMITIMAYMLPVGIIKSQGSNSIFYEIYTELNDYKLAASDMGILTTVRLDLQGVGSSSGNIVSDLVVSNENQQNNTTGSENQETTYEANIMEIDFDKLIRNESNEDIKKLHEYFNATTPTYKNKYTGMFEGYNLIFLTAEAFSPYCVDKDVTPTLYKMINHGFVFRNFYTPIWNTSTSDGEYVACIGLVPDGSHSFRRSSSISLPFTMAAQFNRLGVQSLAYHDGSLSYYDRYKSHPNMGYQFKAARLGSLSESEYGDWIFPMDNPNAWPASDLEMMEGTVGDYVSKEQFHAYYMTISGHQYYNWDGNNQSKKNKDAVANLNYSEADKAYIAANIELDKALEYLIQKLEENGALEKTVIALSADHYPYGLTNDEISELAGHSIEENFELYKNGFILWNASMEEPIVIDKMASSMDIIPTLSNLFGFEFDSRLLAGRDLLSDAEPLVMFKNKSFITDKIMYNSSTKEVTYLVDKSQVSEEYIEQKVQEVKNRFLASSGILNNDYYSYLKDELKWKTKE